MVAACFESVGKPKKTHMASGSDKLEDFTWTCSKSITLQLFSFGSRFLPISSNWSLTMTFLGKSDYRGVEKPAEMDKQPKREIKANHKSRIKFANKRMNFVIKSFMNNFRFLPYSNSEVWNPWLTVAKSEKPYSGLVYELDVGNIKPLRLTNN